MARTATKPSQDDIEDLDAFESRSAEPTLSYADLLKVLAPDRDL